MTATPKTIQIFLPSGEPHGIRIAEITTRIVQVIEVPRSLLSRFLSMEQSSQVGVYFLIGEDTEDGDRLVYVGQTGDLRARLTAHNQKKDFWERALVFVSKTNSLTQTHALFLEWHALQQIRSAGRFAEENGNSASRPHTPAPLEAECFEVFETGSVLVSSLGYPLFDPVAKPKQSEEPEEVLSLRSPSNGVEAKGLYTAEGFVVLAGSVGRADTAPSLGETNERWRQRLLDAGVMQPDDQGRLVFPKDHLFKSPSGAAIALLGRTANGWREWKNSHGQTLHQLVREGGTDEPHPQAVSNAKQESAVTRTLTIRHVPDDVAERPERLASRAGVPLSTFALQELSETARRADNAELLQALPSADLDASEILAALRQSRAEH